MPPPPNTLKVGRLEGAIRACTELSGRVLELNDCVATDKDYLKKVRHPLSHTQLHTHTYGTHTIEREITYKPHMYC